MRDFSGGVCMSVAHVVLHCGMLHVVNRVESVKSALLMMQAVHQALITNWLDRVHRRCSAKVYPVVICRQVKVTCSGSSETMASLNRCENPFSRVRL
jgi:hypothetical protein